MQVQQKNIRVDQPPRLIRMQQAEEKQLYALVGGVVAKGGCVGIIVNTVHRAQQLAQELQRISLKILSSSFMQGSSWVTVQIERPIYFDCWENNPPRSSAGE